MVFSPFWGGEQICDEVRIEKGPSQSLELGKGKLLTPSNKRERGEGAYLLNFGVEGGERGSRLARKVFRSDT